MSFLLTAFWRIHKPVLPGPPTVQLDKQCNCVCLRPRCEQFNQGKIRQKIRVKFLTFLELAANEKHGCIFYRKVATGMAGTKTQSCVPSQTKWLSFNFKASGFWCTAKLKVLLLFQQTNSRESVRQRVWCCYFFQNDSSDSWKHPRPRPRPPPPAHRPAPNLFNSETVVMWLVV